MAIIALVLVSFSRTGAQDAANGKSLFETHCTSCHAIDSKLIGPALAGVNERRDEAWLLNWIKNSQAMVKAGDPIAVKLFNENNKSIMNSFENLSDGEIKDILAYIATGGEKAPAADPGTPTDTGVTTTSGAASEGTPGWMIAAILLALVIIIVQIFNILKLVSEYTNIPFFNSQRSNAQMMIIFLVLGMFGVFWEFANHGKYMLTDNAASDHGDSIDFMFNITLGITLFVFVVTQITLFAYSYMYRGREGRKATFYAHNNKLEVIWTIIPAIVLTVLVLNGFNMWTKITDKAPEDAEEIEVFAYQFGWKVRYAGADKTLGQANFNLISGTNALGVGVKSEYNAVLEEAKATLAALTEERDFLALNTDPTPEEAEEKAMVEKKYKLAVGHHRRLLAMATNDRVFDGTANDDVFPNEIHLPVGKAVNFTFRARDVIHSAYMPYFRVQMNCVPGMPTKFWFKPTKTTSEMRQHLASIGREDAATFDYYLFCAKICGAAHFNMKMKVIVETQAEYDAWLKEQTEKNTPYLKSETPVKADKASEASKEIVLN